jgi:hypothetical protein
MSNNSSMSKLIRLVEGQQFAGEPTLQSTNNEVIHNKLVGEDTTLEDTLAKKYSNFKDVQSKKNTTGEIQKPKKQGVAEGDDMAELIRRNMERSAQKGHSTSKHNEFSWTAMGEDISVEDKMRIVEEYSMRGSLTESLDQDKKDYFESLFSMSDTPVAKHQYIVVSLALVGNKITNMGVHANLKFIEKTNRMMVFSTADGQKTFPTKTMRDLSLFNTFTFLTEDAYNKFRSALAIKFDISLPKVKVKKNTVAEAAKWRNNHNAYDVDDEGNKSLKTANKFSYDPLTHRQNTAADSKTARGKKSALKTSIGMAKGQHGPKGYLPEQSVAESSKPKLGTVRANLMHTEKPTVQVQIFKHNTLRGDSYWVTKEVKKFKTMDHAQAYIDRINKQDVAEAGLKFHGGFPEVDHMRGSVIRDAEMATDNVKVKNKDEWERAVNSINAKVFDDESEFISSSKGTSVEGNGVVWAKWDNDTQSGWFNVQGHPLKSWPVQESKEATADKKATAKIASLEKKIKDAQDALGLARERRRMKGQRQQGPREIALSSKMNALRQQIDTIKREAAQTNESEDFSELEEQLNELSTSLLGKYKTAAGKAASEADKRGDFETGNKRFSGIMKATKKQFANDSKSAKKESAELGETDSNPVDTITMDVPLMIRIMEYAREDAKTDMDLHDVAEKLIKLGTSGRALSMQDYSAIMPQQNEDQLTELGATNSAATLAAPSTVKPAAPGTTAPVKPGTPAPAAPGTSPTTAKPASPTTAKPASPTTTAAATPAKLNPDEQTALNKIMANAGLKGQFQQLIQKAKTVPGA